jgi:hypothetical protein
MAARRVRRAHHGRLWRPARVATPTRPPTGTTTPPSRQPVRTAAARHQARPGRPRHAARAPPPAFTPAPSGRLGGRSGAPLNRPQPRHAEAVVRHQPQKPNGITGKEEARTGYHRYLQHAAGPLAGPAVFARGGTSPEAVHQMGNPPPPAPSAVDDPRHILCDDDVLVRVVVTRRVGGTPAPGPGRRSPLAHRASHSATMNRPGVSEALPGRATFALAYGVEFA